MRQTIRRTAVIILVHGTQKKLRKLILATIGILVFVLADLAKAVTNYTDMWFNSSESGWGVNFTQDYNGPIFATFFVYAANGVPTWVIAALTFDPVTGEFPVLSSKLRAARR